MQTAKVILQGQVPQAWIDYNGHMNDAEYVRAFSTAVDAFMDKIGIDEAFREAHHYTIYTLESHICYLDEMHLDEAFEVHVQFLNYDAKRLHLFFELYGADGKRAATSEQMLMGMDQTSGRPGAFPDHVFKQIEQLANDHTPVEAPKEAGRVIGIRKKK